MLNWIVSAYGEAWGPLRLLGSFFFLAGVGYGAAALATWIALPRLWHLLPQDRGRAHAVNAEHSVGKPLSAGLIFISIFCIICILFLPFEARAMRTLPLMVVAMLVGFVDDRTPGGLSEYTLGGLDLVIAFASAAVILGFGDSAIWLPGWKDTIMLPAWASLPLATGVIWLSINATNCSDGVDGVSGSLTAIAIALLGVLLYAVIGSDTVAAHLAIPVNVAGANWAIMAFVMVGAVSGYLWYNAPPSLVLMGDAGSRPLGLLIGMLVVATGNPLFLLLVGTVILVNGATGLVKVAVTRFFGIRILSSIRFPLHDHCRKNLGWSNSQVLVRFLLLHIGLSALLVTLVLKVR
ncbi:MAG: phospho-N-acetylmuramoyl-pentapeptide-transferase [Proteobacteria bacterium]|nr:phospho-N-acetylmuramoyl-pentapeptide-transferase [Pseudomonadota bacterium]